MEQTDYELRYMMEQEIFPTLFFKEPDLTLNCLCHPTLNYYHDVMEAFYKQHGKTMPYKKEDFKRIPFKFQDAYILIIELPTPEQSPLCHRIYLLSDENFENVKYFTIEKSLDILAEKDITFLCERSKDGAHLNYGPILNTNDENMERTMVFANYKNLNEAQSTND